MSIFGSIMQKIFHHGEAAAAADATTSAAASGSEAVPESSGSGATVSATSSLPAAVPAPAQPPVDVGAVLAQMASGKGGGGNYQTSIVDLLKLLDLDSSMDARKQLAQELDIHTGADGSAEENIALHKAVMQKLAENGGKVPDSLKG